MTRMTALEVAERLVFMSEQVPILHELTAAMTELLVSHTENWDDPITLTESNNCLKADTGFIVQLDPTVSCYPTGLATAVLFDEDGNPIP